jgi:hypothetical protein
MAVIVTPKNTGRERFFALSERVPVILMLLPRNSLTSQTWLMLAVQLEGANAERGNSTFASVVVLIEVGLRRRLAAMTPFTKFIFCAAVASLTFGLPWPDPQLAGGRAPFPQNYVVLAANEEQSSQPQTQTQESADESDKMNTPGMQEDEEAQNPSQPPGAHPSNEN